MDQPDHLKRWSKARQSILSADNLWEQLVKMSAAGAADYEFLQGKDPLFITNYFIAKMIQG
jgi:hypothetical protein